MAYEILDSRDREALDSIKANLEITPIDIYIGSNIYDLRVGSGIYTLEEIQEADYGEATITYTMVFDSGNIVFYEDCTPEEFTALGFVVGSEYRLTIDLDRRSIDKVERVIDLKDKVNISDINQTYSPTSTKPQSGIAVAEAVQEANRIYVGEGDMPEGYNIQINPKGSAFELPEVDQTYNPESPNAQSGVAVAEALSEIGGGGLKEYELLCDTTITEDVASVKWTTTDNGEPIGNYKDFFIYFLGKFTAEESKAMWCKSEGQYFMWSGNLAKKTSVRGFWLSIEQIFSTDEIDSAPDATSRDGTAIFISKYPKLFLSNVTEGLLSTQGLSGNNEDLCCDTTIMGTTDLPLKELQIGQAANSTAIFASGSRFLLLGRKA